MRRAAFGVATAFILPAPRMVKIVVAAPLALVAVLLTVGQATATLAILYVIDKSRTFEISVWVDERGVSIENQPEYPIYQQMLSTFRFTDH